MTQTELARTLRTVRHLRASQLWGQLRLRLRGPRGPVAFDGAPPELAIGAPAAPFLGAPAHAFTDGWRRFRLLHREVVFGDRPDWDFVGEGPLWAYHLHQFDHARRTSLAPEARRALLLDWIARHESGVGWEPGPISLRCFSWIKLLLTRGALPKDPERHEAIRRSLASQLTTLADRLETHLLANHYFSNLAALVFAGLAFEGAPARSWLAHEAAFRGQLDEQVLADGAHCERSPMYHSLLLEHVLDLLNVATAPSARAPSALVSHLREAASRMLGALAVLTHPDGGIALFGDSAHGIAHSPAALGAYAKRLGVDARGPARAGCLDRAGFVRLERGPFVLIASVAGPLPEHQPGHAHCDALSFELSVGRDRVVTDTGVYEYVPGALRDLSRATRSHATLEVGGVEQAEVWAAHRVGGRPQVSLVAYEPGLAAEATCAGWSTRDSVHRRRFTLSEAAVEIADALEGRTRPVRMQLPLAPGLEPKLEGARAHLRLPSGGWLRLDLPAGLPWTIERAPSFPEFGRREERAVLVAAASHLERCTWRLSLPERRVPR
ncbi:MAG TPA: heparinase II/III family protein [Myxococcota bacterium]|nr:heparinase II/III family protein [Myxococcota bacterium]